LAKVGGLTSSQLEGNTKMDRTYSPKTGEVERRWYLVDASEAPLGRVCTRVARLLTGKHKPRYAPHIDTGDFVVVINAEKAILTGRKETLKIYYRHSTHPGGLKQETAGEVRETKPTKLVERGPSGLSPCL